MQIHAQNICIILSGFQDTKVRSQHTSNVLKNGEKKGIFSYTYTFSFEFEVMVKEYLTNQHSSLKNRNLRVVNKLPNSDRRYKINKI